ncbi:MAG: DUF1501 domain-containing protein, partial [Planctomycetaceae bacterium]
MLTGPPHQQRRSSPGLGRRDVLRIGCLGPGGLSLPHVLQAENQAGNRNTDRAVVMIYLPGG